VYEGEPDPELTQMLKPPPLDRKTMLPQATPAPTAPPVWDPAAPPPSYRILKRGASGSDVWLLQTKLTLLGYYRGTISAGYYEGTAAAVKAFQQAAGLQADGVAGPVTLKTLYEDLAYATPDAALPSAGGAIPADQGAPSATLFPASTPIPLATPAPTAPPSPAAAQSGVPAAPEGVVWLTPPPPPPGF
jgi:peptidoglycan hydrolase-like protein with peptidoglycan-binding domain